MDREDVFRLFLPSCMESSPFQPTFTNPNQPTRPVPLDISHPSPLTEPNVWDRLPDDIVIHEIFSRFNLEDLESWVLVSRRFYKLAREAISFRKTLYNTQLQLASTGSPHAFFHFLHANNLRITQRSVNMALWKNTDENGKLILQACPTGYTDMDTISFRENPGQQQLVLMPIIPGASDMPPGIEVATVSLVPDEDEMLDDQVQEILDTEDFDEKNLKECTLCGSLLIERMTFAILGRKLWFFEYFGTDIMHGRAPFTRNKIEANFSIQRDSFFEAIVKAFHRSEPDEKIATLDFVNRVLPLMFNPDEIDLDVEDDDDRTPEHFFVTNDMFASMLAGILMGCTKENALEVFGHRGAASDFAAMLPYDFNEFIGTFFEQKTLFVSPAVLELAYDTFDDWKEDVDSATAKVLSYALSCRSTFLTMDQELSLARLIELLWINGSYSTWELTQVFEQLSEGLFKCVSPSFYNHLYYHTSLPGSVLTAVASQWRQHPHRIILAMWCSSAGLLRLSAREVFNDFQSKKDSGVLSDDFFALVSSRVQAFWFGVWPPLA